MKYFKIDYKEFIKSAQYYDLVIIDPPWKFNDKHPALDAQLSYTLWDNNIDSLNYCFNNLNCNYLLLWTCNSLLNDVFIANKNTKFIYKTMITWRKLTSKNNDFYGLGNSFRNSTEQLLLFSTKNAKPLRTPFRTIINEQCSIRTCKPKDWESKFIEFINLRKMSACYIFSGIFLNKFKNLNIDCIDIIDKENILFE